MVIKKHQHRWFFTFTLDNGAKRYRCKHCSAFKYEYPKTGENEK
jgi:hypothetical protein